MGGVIKLPALNDHEKSPTNSNTFKKSSILPNAGSKDTYKSLQLV